MNAFGFFRAARGGRHLVHALRSFLFANFKGWLLRFWQRRASRFPVWACQDCQHRFDRSSSVWTADSCKMKYSTPANECAVNQQAGRCLDGGDLQRKYCFHSAIVGSRINHARPRTPQRGNVLLGGINAGLEFCLAPSRNEFMTQQREPHRSVRPVNLEHFRPSRLSIRIILSRAVSARLCGVQTRWETTVPGLVSTSCVGN